MKIYNPSPSEGYKQLIGYQCDSCGITGREDFPELWIEEYGEHYCSECQVSCLKCKRLFSNKYAESWFLNHCCENCQENTQLTIRRIY